MVPLVYAINPRWKGQPNLTANASLLVSSLSFRLAYSPPLYVKKPVLGNPKLIHQLSFKADMMVSAFLFEISFPCMNLVKLSNIQRTYLLSNSFRSRETVSLNKDDLSIVTLGWAIDLWNFWHTQQSFTTLCMIFSSLGLIQLALL